MRTTVDIDDDVLRAAKERARRQGTSAPRRNDRAAKERTRREGTTAGSVISDLARRALNGTADVPAGPKARAQKAVVGVRPVPKRGGIVSNELIDTLRGDDAY